MNTSFVNGLSGVYTAQRALNKGFSYLSQILAEKYLLAL